MFWYSQRQRKYTWHSFGNEHFIMDEIEIGVRAMMWKEEELCFGPWEVLGVDPRET